MATLETSQYALQKTSRANTSRNATANITSGRVEFANIAYTLTGSEAANDVINLGILPAGAIPVPQLSNVTCSADPGTTLTLKIGTAADDNGWADGIVLSAGGQVACTNTNIPAWVAQTPLVADSGVGNAVVFATVASAASLTASVVLYFVLAYKKAI